MRILLLCLTFVFAAELEVEGDLKVTGNIDVQNNPIKNVGIPQELTDAINGNILQDALRDDANYEYQIIILRIYYSNNSQLIPYSGSWFYLDDPSHSGEYVTFTTEFQSLLNHISYNLFQKLQYP